MNWFRQGLAPWKPIHTLLFADKKVFFWIKDKLGLSDYQMAALLWLKGLVTGALLGLVVLTGPLGMNSSLATDAVNESRSRSRRKYSRDGAAAEAL